MMNREEFRKKYKEAVICYTIWQVFTVGWFNISKLLADMKPEENMPGVSDCLADYVKLSLTDQRWLMKRYL